MSLQVLWQQTPSVQKPLPQSELAAHFAPSPLDVPVAAASVMVAETADVRDQLDGTGLAAPQDHLRAVERVELEAQRPRGARRGEVAGT